MPTSLTTTSVKHGVWCNRAHLNHNGVLVITTEQKLIYVIVTHTAPQVSPRLYILKSVATRTHERAQLKAVQSYLHGKYRKHANDHMARESVLL